MAWFDTQISLFAQPTEKLENLTPRSSMSKCDSECLVFGFVAEIESELLSKCVIPRSLRELCFKYYYICEYFAKHGKYIILNEIRDIAWRQKGSDQHSTIYGHQITDPSDKSIKSYKWTLKLLGFENKNGFFMGIDSSNEEYLENHFTSWYYNKHAFYAFTVTKYKRRNGYGSKKANHLIFQVNDIVCLELNVKNKTFSIIINDDLDNSAIHENVAIENVTYRLAITLTFAHHKVQLIKYETENY